MFLKIENANKHRTFFFVLKKLHQAFAWLFPNTIEKIKESMKRKFLLLMLVAGISALFVNCRKEPLNNLTEEESRIYITDHDSTAIFSAYHTYSISDSVAVISDGSSTKQLNEVDQAYINAVKKYMMQTGYTLVNKDQNPDLGVNINRIINTSTGVITTTTTGIIMAVIGILITGVIQVTIMRCLMHTAFIKFVKALCLLTCLTLKTQPSITK